LDNKTFPSSEVSLFKWMIDRDYRINFYLDKLPAGLNFTITHDVHYYSGIPIGYKEYNIDGTFTYILYNHYTFNVHVNRNNNKYTVVGFHILPLSIRHNGKDDLKCAIDKDSYNANFRNHERQTLMELGKDESMSIDFTYDVVFRDSNIPFSSRWDHYLHLENDKIHWFSLINSGLIILIFSLIVIYIFCRALKKDIEIYNTVVFNNIASYQ
jgi:transmembrane 9 superfamily protein 2/4